LHGAILHTKYHDPFYPDARTDQKGTNVRQAGPKPGGAREEKRWNGYTVPQRHRRLSPNWRRHVLATQRSRSHRIDNGRRAAARCCRRGETAHLEEKIHEQK
jgi:hypothetical protein